MTELMERLRAEARQQAEAQWQSLQTEINRYAIAPQERAQIERAQAEVVALMKQDTYFGYLDALAKILACRSVFESLRLPERDRLRDQVTGALAQLRAEMAEYVMPDSFRERLNRELAEVERLLAQMTFASASAARDKMDACEEQEKAMMAGWVERAVLEGHTSTVYAIAFSPDGATLASGSDDNTVRLWELVIHKVEWEQMECERMEHERMEQQKKERQPACGQRAAVKYAAPSWASWTRWGDTSAASSTGESR